MGLAASKQEAFWEACGFGHVEKVKKFLLQEDIDVNWKSYTVSIIYQLVGERVAAKRLRCLPFNS